jgi:hypothetical protein
MTERTQLTSGERLKAWQRQDGQIGDPRFLAGVQWCINKRCEILGLDAPAKFAPTDVDGKTTFEFVVTYANRADTNQPTTTAPEAS